MTMIKGRDENKNDMKTPMTQADASRIQSATARSSGGGVQAGSFASRVQSAGDKNARQSGVVEADKKKADRDNHANQLNPNNPAYQSCSWSDQPEDEDCPEIEKLCDSDED
jgi:hypothetical protein